MIQNQSTAPAGEDLSGIDETASGLRVPNGESLLLVGGDVILDGGGINAFGGRVELGGLAEAGEVQVNYGDTEESSLSLSFPEQVSRANVSLTNEALINVPLDNGGDIVINANNITITEGSILRAGFGDLEGSADSQAGDITLDATNELEITNSSTVTNQVFPEAQGTGGDITLNAGSLLISNDVRVVAATFSIGDSGDIRINVPDGLLEISNNSLVFSGTESLSNDRFESTAVGNAGDIEITAQKVWLDNNSLIDASSFGQGDAGNIDISLTEDLILTSDSLIINGINPEAIGDAGDINIAANNVSLDSGSQIGSNIQAGEENQAGGQGNGGNISLNVVDSVKIRGAGSTGFSSGILTTAEAGTEGQAGEIVINTDSFQIADGAIVSSQTFNESNGGNISINANNFEATGGGQVTTSAADSGNAGDISIQVTNDLLLSGSDPNFANRLAEFEEKVGNEAPGNSGIFANVRSDASGVGGDILVTAGELKIEDGAEINVSATGLGEAGSLNIDAQNIALDDGSFTADTTAGDQGNITIDNAETLLLFSSSQITTNATELATGGDIFIDADAIVILDNSGITANAVLGQGGNIQIITQGILQESDSQISATSELGIDGTISINSFDVDPTSGILELPDVPLDTAKILAQDLCKLSDNKIANGSSFIITGRGGLTPTSKDSLSNRDRIVDWARREELEVSDNGTVGVNREETAEITEPTYPVIQQSQGLIVAADGSKWLTANAPNTVPQNSSAKHPDCQS